MTRILQRLEKEGYRFNFFQAIKLLEGADRERPQIGHIGPYRHEVVRLQPNDELAFAPADVSRIRRTQTDELLDKWVLVQNFLGLYGPNSASPMYIAEFIAQCPSDEDPLRDFLDIFNHRILSLYYRSWKKHNLSASVTSGFQDAFSKILLAITGFDNEVSDAGRKIPPHRMLRFCSFFASSARPASGLENLISDYFELDDVSITQFAPRRYSPPKSALSRLSNADDGGRLGESFVIGETITDVAGQFKISLDNLTMEQFLSFQPGETQYDELIFLTNMYVKHQLGFFLELSLKPNQGGSLKLSSIDPIGVLGRSSWLGYPSEKETSVTFEAHQNY